MQIGTDTVESSMETPQILKMDLPFDPAIPLLGIYLKKPKTNSKECKHHYVYCSLIYNFQDTETAQMSISRWVGKTSMGHLHNGILLSHKKEKLRAKRWRDRQPTWCRGQNTGNQDAHSTDWARSQNEGTNEDYTKQ